MLGYFGFGNTGDEAMLAAQVAALRSTVGADTEFVVVSGDPTRTASLHRLPAVARTDVAGLARALRTCDGVVAGGGSLLQDVTSARPVAYYAGLLLAARALRKPVFAYAQGLGPLRRRFNRALAAAALRSASYVSMRDEDARALAGALGVRNVELVPDPVLGAGAFADDMQDDLRAGAQRPGRLAVALRPWHGSDGPKGWLPVLRDVLVDLRPDVDVQLVAFHTGQDVHLARKLAADIGSVPVVVPAGPSAAAGALAGATAVLGMRLHALVLAAALGRPFVALSYDPKVASFAAQVGQPVAASIPGPIDRDALLAAVRNALDGPDQAYLVRVADLRARSRRPALAIAHRLGRQP
jgi:polysaccharide pyruvyl transferase CsaB